MSTKKAKTFNSQVYDLACNHLKLKRREKTIFYRLLGFLIRNDKPFPYSVPSLSKVTGYGRTVIFESLNILERFGLINRAGLGPKRKFHPGHKLVDYFATVRNRTNNDLYNMFTTVRIPDSKVVQPSGNRIDENIFSLKLKEKEFSQSELQEINYYKKNPDILILEEHKYLFNKT